MPAFISWVLSIFTVYVLIFICLLRFYFYRTNFLTSLKKLDCEAFGVAGIPLLLEVFRSGIPVIQRLLLVLEAQLRLQVQA